MSDGKLVAPGVDRLIGCGVYYGSALTETASCAGQDVYIVGVANSAGRPGETSFQVRLPLREHRADDR